MIPAWMRDSDAPAIDPGKSGRRRDYVERTLARGRETIRELLSAGEWATRDGLLQRLDPRAKLLSALALILVSTLAHRQPVVWSVPVLALALAVASRIPARLFAGRVWLPVLFFTGLIVLPATLNLVTPGPALLVLFETGGLALGPWKLPGVVTITRSGVDVAALVLGRAGGCVSVVMLLTLTTRWPELLEGLRDFRVSAVFVMIIEMAHRYAFVLVSLLDDVHKAKRSRTISRSTARRERAWVGSRMGAMFLRSRRLTESVYHAMLARGYDGEPKTARTAAMRLGDWLVVSGSLTVLFLVLALDRFWRL